MKKTLKKGFTIVELVIVIAVVAILASVLIPTFSGVIDKANNSAALQNASNAYKQYAVDHVADGMPEMFLWSDGNGKFAAIKNGAVIGVYGTKAEAVKELCGEDLTNIANGETATYKIESTGTEKLSALVIKSTGKNYARGNIIASKSVLPDRTNQTPSKLTLYHETLKLAEVSVPYSAIQDGTMPVTVTISSMDNYLASEEENVTGYAYDIHVDNLKSDLSDNNCVTVTLSVPEGVISPRVYHKENLISDAAYDKTAAAVTFKALSFSPFAVAYTEKHVSTWNDLRAAMKEDNVNVVVDADIEVDLGVNIKNNENVDYRYCFSDYRYAWVYGVDVENKNVALDLNGHRIEVSCNSSTIDKVSINNRAIAAFHVAGDCDLTIKDSAGGGVLQVNNEPMYAVWGTTLDKGLLAPRIDIYGGTFVSYTLINPDKNGRVREALCYVGERGDLYVHGGTFLYRHDIYKNGNSGGFNVMDRGYDHTTTIGTKFDNPDSTLTIGEGVIISNEMYGQLYDVSTTGRVRLAKGLTVVKTGEKDPAFGLDLYKVVKKAEPAFKNIDTYLYRIGNSNAIKISSLYNLVEGAINAYGDFTYGELTIEKAGADSDVKWTITPDESDYGEGTIKFGGTGVVKVQVDGGCELLLEVVDGKNVTTFAEMSNSVNNVMLCDIEIASGKGFTLRNATLYGNGFTFDITKGTHAANTQGVITVSNASIDNVKIIGAVYTEYADVMSKEYYNSAVAATGGDCYITNSHISGCHSAVRVSTANLTVDNAVLYGGRLSNLEITSGNVTLRDVTTVNEPVTSGGTTVLGFGIFIYDYASGVTLNIDGDFTQYNWAKQSDKAYLPSSSSMSAGVNFAFGSSCKQFQKTYNGETYVNFGILNLSGNVATTAVNGQPSDYAFVLQSSGAWVCTVKEDSSTASNMFANGVPDYDETAYKPTVQGAIKPTFTWNYPSEYNAASGKILLSFERGQSATLEPNFLTATKNGNSLSVSVAMNGTDYTGSYITFTTAGDYTVTYALTDPYNYNKDASTYCKDYIFTVPVQVIVTEPEQKNAEFKYTDGSGTKTVTINGKTYVMPDVGGTSRAIASTTVGGQTVYMPIVEVRCEKKSSQWDLYAPVFTAINIDDDGTVYNSSSTALPTNFGYEGNGATSPYYYGGNKQEPKKYSSYGMCYYSTKSTSATPAYKEQAQKVCFYYTDKAGKTTYYYIQYHFPASANESSSSCITPDTLITLADGTQKRVDSLNGTEKLLVWNMATGKLDSAPIMFIDSDPVTEYEVICLYFSDGTEVKVISEHGFWDYDLNRYVYLDDSASEYIGHTFAKQSGNELGKVTLDRVEIVTEKTSAWSPVTAGHLCYFVNGMLSMPGGVGGLFNIFEVDAETMTYNAEAMQRDIETYGLFTYEELNEICPLPEEMFIAAGGEYLKVSIGKGNLTMEELVAMIKRYTEKFN